MKVLHSLKAELNLHENDPEGGFPVFGRVSVLPDTKGYFYKKFQNLSLKVFGGGLIKKNHNIVSLGKCLPLNRQCSDYDGFSI